MNQYISSIVVHMKKENNPQKGEVIAANNWYHLGNTPFMYCTSVDISFDLIVKTNLEQANIKRYVSKYHQHLRSNSDLHKRLF